MRVKLLTKDGSYISTVTVPPFQTMPEVLLWGARAFIPMPNSGLDEEHAMRYVEVMLFEVKVNG